MPLVSESRSASGVRGAVRLGATLSSARVGDSSYRDDRIETSAGTTIRVTVPMRRALDSELTRAIALLVTNATPTILGRENTQIASKSVYAAVCGGR